MKKTLIVTTTQDVTPFTDDYIDLVVEQVRQAAKASGANVAIKVVKEDDGTTSTDMVDRLLQSALGEVKDGDERPRD